MAVENSFESTKAIIFGCGEAGLAAKRNLEESYEFVAFCDNSDAKIGRTIEGLKVLSADQLIDTDNKIVILIASEYSEQIYNQLTTQLKLDAKRVRYLSAKDIKHFSIGHSSASRLASNEVLLLVSESLLTARITHYVDAGTLLGIIRDNALIPWDDDLDLAVSHHDVKALQELFPFICKKLEASTNTAWCVDTQLSEREFYNVPAGAIRAFKLRTAQPSLTLPMVDFFVKYVGDDWMDYTLSSRGFRMPSKHIQETQVTQYMGGTIQIPGHVESYLDRHYGDWRTPDPTWNLSQLKNAAVFEGNS
ncbi:LicD family protein [Aliiglaciecola sp. M165]|uniref:LicD family protein n=1 Tax=Aliiglaciecola sp. M165 TaxID=2593649 RepID=UPI00117E22D4|nr:LicD family protein [Aliiglaciecola sp. M165]TRY30940.1 LicD family protein [Aliiglaciecola sp. M165]